MPPSRPERYNAKARKSIAGASSHKKKRRKLSSVHEDMSVDPNAPILEEKSEREKEVARREVIREQILLSDQSITSKKKRRLEKYIDKQLRKEERVHILQQLAKTQAQLPSTEHLQSSATLGTGRLRSAADDAASNENLRVSKEMARSNLRINHQEDSDEDGPVESGSDSSTRSPGQPNPVIFTSTKEGHAPKVTSPGGSALVGGALKRNEDGTLAAPIMKPRKAQPTKFASWKGVSMPIHQKAPSNRDSSSSDVDNSDSAFDSNGDDESVEKIVRKNDKSHLNSSIPAKSSSGQKRNFKDWANEQIRASIASPVEGYQSYTNIEAMMEAEANLGPSFKRQKRDEDTPRGPMGSKLEISDTEFARKAQLEQKESMHCKFVSICRTDDVRTCRAQLPILGEEQRILEAVLLHPVVVICGQTGSGKTTQVPQFLYEAGYGNVGSNNPGMIGITQPRRVAAISMAARVAEELALPSTIVSHQIRYDTTTGPSTAIKFMTDGVLLREMATDFLLSRYSVVIVDEAHERSLNTDILIGTLSRIIRLREDMWREGKAGAKPLRLIIMSATLRVADFVENTSLFNTPPPIVEIESRQHTVTIHYDRRTRSDYVTQAFIKAVKIHSRLPPGGILVFLTGQQEIIGLCRNLEKRFGTLVMQERRIRRQRKTTLPLLPKLFPGPKDETAPVRRQNWDVEVEELDFGHRDQESVEDIDDREEPDEDEDALDTDDGDVDEDEGLYQPRGDDVDASMHVVPLYSLLSGQKQMEVFKSPPEGSRLVVVATNIAETSLTIPGIRYVIDCGRAKERNYDIASGVQSFQVSWISKSSAAQRAGRAGRTGPGHCYRLYSSSLFEHYFEEHSKAEILRTPIEGTVLQMKYMHIDTVVNFPFPTPPDRDRLRKAELVLTRLGAIEKPTGKPYSQITDLGRLMSMFPVEPRLGKMLASRLQHGCLPYVIAIVAGLTVGDPFLREEGLGSDQQDEDREVSDFIRGEEAREKEYRRRRRVEFFEKQKLHSQLGGGYSDVFRLLSVIGAYEYAGGSNEFCQEHFVRSKTMEEIHKLRRQLSAIATSVLHDADPQFSPRLSPPNFLQLKILRQLLASGFIDQVAVRKDIVEKGSSGDKHASSRGVAYRAIDIEEDVFIHPSSVLYHQSPPEYVVYCEVVRGSHTWLKTVTVINPSWLAQLGPTMCTYSKPLPVPPTISDMKPGEVLVIPRFGPGWELPALRKMK